MSVSKVETGSLTLDSVVRDLRPCAFCGGAIALRLDKQGRPYMRCPYCGTTAFLKSYAALAGFLLQSDHVAEDRGGFMRKVEVLQAKMMGMTPLEPAHAPTPQVEEQVVADPIRARDFQRASSVPAEVT